MWVWLLCAARWKPSRMMVDGEEILLERGQVFVSIRTFAAENGVSKGIAERFLRDLKSGTMIETVNKTRGTLITICNYNEYQDFDAYRETADKTDDKTAAGQQRDSGGTAAGHKRNQNKPDKPDNPDEIEEVKAVSTATLSHADWAFAEFCNLVAGSSIPVPHKLTADRKRKIDARLKEHGNEAWLVACTKLAQSDFCNGANDRGWKADFDFLCQPKSFNRLIEGGYDNRSPPRSTKSKTDAAIRRFVNRGEDHGQQDQENDLRNVFSLPAIRGD